VTNESATELMGRLASPAGQSDPYPIYARLRELGEAVAGPDGSVVVTGYRAGSAVLHDNRLRKEPGRLLAQAGYPDWEQRPSLRTMYGSILMLNPPEHTRLRGLVSRSFTARRVAGLREAITRIADELLDGLGGTIDFIDAVAFPFPVTVIGELLGVPPADRAMFQPLVHDWAAVLEVLNPLAVDTADAAAITMRDYLGDLADERRAQPRDDLISALVADQRDGNSLTADELVTMAALILGAGFETTTGLLANGLIALLAHPEQADRLRTEPELAKPAAEELLRYDTPVQIIYSRIVVQDMLVGDLEVSAGQRLMTLIGSANRDPSVFTEPETLRLDRHEGTPLSFGGGIHHCLGAALARLEVQVIVPELLRRFPALRLAGEPARRGGLAIRGYASLPVALED
jgi:cytochrome P450